MGLFTFDTSDWVQPPQEIVDYVKRTLARVPNRELFDHSERRAEPRHRVALNVAVMPIDTALKPAGEHFMAVTRDISSRGLCLFSVQPVDNMFLALKLPDVNGQTLQAVMEVLRCRPSGPFFEIGGKFVTKVYDRDQRPGSARGAKPRRSAPATNCDVEADSRQDENLSEIGPRNGDSRHGAD